MEPNQRPVNALGSNAAKLRLNTEQWMTLERLADSTGTTVLEGQMTVTGRLASNGLVATDERGRTYLTILGLQRLNQGR